MVTPEREKIIRGNWPRANRYGFENGPVVRVPLRPKVQPPPVTENGAVLEHIETLEYRLEHGYQNDRKWARVVCEGVVVAEGPRY